MLKTYEVTLEVKLYINANDANEAEENAFNNTFGDEVRVIDVIEMQSDYPNEDSDRERYWEENMLTVKQLEEKAKLENLKIRLDSLDRDLKFGTITKKQYEKESMLIGKELAELEALNHTELRDVFNEMMGYPMEAIDNLIEEGRKIFQ